MKNKIENDKNNNEKKSSIWKTIMLIAVIAIAGYFILINCLEVDSSTISYFGTILAALFAIYGIDLAFKRDRELMEKQTALNIQPILRFNPLIME